MIGTDAIDRDVQEALEAFGVRPDAIKATPGNTTRLWRVDAGDSSYVLRRHPRSDAARRRTTHDLLQFLGPRFKSAPEVIMTRDGHDVFEREERLYELLTFLDGDVAVTGWDFDWDDDVFLERAGDLLAQLHSALRQYKPAKDAEWWQPKTLPLQAEATSQLRRDDAEEARKLLMHLPLLYAYLDSFPAVQSPTHVIHNDFAWYNVVRRGHAAVAVIDFDAARVATELHDLAYALYAFAPIRDSVAGELRTFERTAERVAAFVNAYEARLGASLGYRGDAVLDAAAYRVAALGAELIAGYLQREERAIRLLSHAVGYADWLSWYAEVRPHLVDAVTDVSDRF